jgi:DNA-binding NarL/FixJ family response regulator
MSSVVTRVLIVDDHPMVRDMIRLGCEDRPQIEVVGEAGTGDEALEASERLKPDVVVLDLVMPGFDGFEVIRRLRHERSTARILVVTNRDDAEAALEAVRLGAAGYLLKTSALDELLDAIEAVGRGEQVFTSREDQLAHSRLRQLARRAGAAARANEVLSRRELEVLHLLADGLSTRQMASRLTLSERTIESHISHLYDKLRVRTRVQAVQRAATIGLIDLEPLRP